MVYRVLFILLCIHKELSSFAQYNTRRVRLSFDGSQVHWFRCPSPICILLFVRNVKFGLSQTRTILIFSYFYCTEQHRYDLAFNQSLYYVSVVVLFSRVFVNWNLYLIVLICKPATRIKVFYPKLLLFKMKQRKLKRVNANPY